jgi:hypothetical protein
MIISKVVKHLTRLLFKSGGFGGLGGGLSAAGANAAASTQTLNSGFGGLGASGASAQAGAQTQTLSVG